MNNNKYDQEDEVICRVFQKGEYYKDKEKCCLEWTKKLNKLSKKTGDKQVNKELYTILALIWNEYINSWYFEITDDEEFGNSSVEIIFELVNSIKELLIYCQVDYFLLQQVPNILLNHFKDCRFSNEMVYRNGYATPKDYFPSLHIGVSSNEYLRILTSKLLDNIEINEISVCERALIQSIISDLILYNLVELLSDPFTIYDLIIKICNDIENEKHKSASKNPGYYNYIACGDIRGVFSKATSDFKSAITFIQNIVSFCLDDSNTTTKHPQEYPLISDVFIQIIGEFTNINSERPWLISTIQLLLLPITSTRLNGFCNKLISNIIYKKLLTPKNISIIIRDIRKILYPDINGNMAINKKNPLQHDKDDKRIEALNAILSLTPHYIMSIYTKSQLNQSLEWFNDPIINKHLIYTLLDEIISTLLPQLCI